MLVAADCLTALCLGWILTSFLFRKRRGFIAVEPVPFMVVVLSSWAGGIWMRPIGPILFGMRLLSFLSTGLVAAFIIRAARRPAKVPDETGREDTTFRDYFFSYAAASLLLAGAVIAAYL